MQSYLLLGHTGYGAVDIFARWPPPNPDPAGSCDISPALEVAAAQGLRPLVKELCAI